MPKTIEHYIMEVHQVNKKISGDQLAFCTTPICLFLILLGIITVIVISGVAFVGIVDALKKL